MSPQKTKSKNIKLYTYFLNYQDPTKIPYNKLAIQLNLHPNKLRGMIRSAKHNDTIYQALREERYSDSQIPRWFARPLEPTAIAVPRPAETTADAEERQPAGIRSEPSNAGTSTVHITHDPRKTAQHPSALSTRSAVPARIAYAEPIRVPESPYMAEIRRIFREDHDEYMRSQLAEMRSQRAPPKIMTLKELSTRAQLEQTRQKVNQQNAAMIFTWINTQRNIEAEKKRSEIEEFIEEISSIDFSRLNKSSKKTNDNTVETVRAIGKLMESLRSTPIANDEYLKKIEVYTRQNRENEEKALINLLNIIEQKRQERRRPIELMKKRNRELFENIMSGLRRNI